MKLSVRVDRGRKIVQRIFTAHGLTGRLMTHNWSLALFALTLLPLFWTAHRKRAYIICDLLRVPHQAGLFGRDCVDSGRAVTTRPQGRGRILTPTSVWLPAPLLCHCD